MYSFWIRNRVTGEQDCLFGYSWEDAKRRHPEYDNGEWFVELKIYED